MLSGAHSAGRVTQLIEVAMTLLIAAAAFRLSFTALRSLAMLSGLSAGEAALWPLIIEGSMAQATVALLVITGSDHRAHTSIDPHSNAETHARPPSDGDPTDRAATVPPITPDLGRPVRTKHPSGETPTPTTRWVELAADICARDTAGRRQPEEVALILTRRFDDGWNATQIAELTQRSRSTVSRVLSDRVRLRPDLRNGGHRALPSRNAELILTQHFDGGDPSSRPSSALRTNDGG
ncbi:DUF2637 domain-containing protein [Nocardia sp. 2]|uniref:DUF2637 domain-containing protein n=1 Tax=Nocardia acididurans TaxID=2802282 RepID=A0ABS1M3V3_9NOCA|nr:DUF2637 domain-containing protein [Nocardia acididurans]MBL1074469.1 DUF2637 domain-containing protein [Nocardia acididurans]